jgi:DNA invertase Pin-like site-specific DNA recombinase
MRVALDGGWSLVSLDPQVDMTMPYGRAMAHMAMVFAELERELISQRIKEALAIKRLNGVRLGRPRAVPNHVRERIVRERVDGATLRQIADDLNDGGVPTVKAGGRWHPATIRSILRQQEAPQA